MPGIGTGEWRILADYIHSICGLSLDDSKQYLVESRLRGLLDQTSSASFGVLYQKARMDATGELERSIIDAITTGETSFFRDQSPFDLLRNKLLPELLDRRKSLPGPKIPLRIWSAACSSGQELYSIAIILREVLGGALDRWDIRLVGTDISPEAVRRAAAGAYNQVEAGRGLPPAMLSRYFVSNDGKWQVREEIRRMTSFRTLNLLRDFSLLGQFDIIFCRNVAIYFSPADKVSLFNRMWNSLASDGYLLIGSTESLAGVCNQFELKRDSRAAYYRKAASA